MELEPASEATPRVVASAEPRGTLAGPEGDGVVVAAYRRTGLELLSRVPLPVFSVVRLCLRTASREYAVTAEVVECARGEAGRWRISVFYLSIEGHPAEIQWLAA